MDKIYYVGINEMEWFVRIVAIFQRPFWLLQPRFRKFLDEDEYHIAQVILNPENHIIFDTCRHASAKV